MHTQLLHHRILVGGLMVIGLVLTAVPGWAQNDNTEKPERLIAMAVEYPGVELPSPDDVDMNITFHNRGRSDETVDVWVADSPLSLVA